MALEIEKLTPSIGARITGADLSRSFDEAAVHAIQDALHAHGVLVFNGQPISDEAHVRFARHFGRLQRFGSEHECGGCPPEIFRSSNVDGAGRFRRPDDDEIKLLKLNWHWHTDSSYLTVPAKGVVLRVIEVANAGGDTVFANNADAYDALPSRMKDRVDRLHVHHNFEFLVRHQDVPPLEPEELGQLPRTNHPLVRQHRDGRRSLFLSPPYMQTVIGWHQRDSLALFAELTDWATQERFVFQHHWSPHDLIVWDNRRTMHRVIPFDTARTKRIMHGTTNQGSEPVLAIE